MSAVLVVAPHPDDETLGCGGTLLRHANEGDTLHWLIVTDMTAESGFGRKQMSRRDGEINAVAEAYGFTTVKRLGFATARLDTVPMDEIVDAMYTVFEEVRCTASARTHENRTEPNIAKSHSSSPGPPHA